LLQRVIWSHNFLTSSVQAAKSENSVAVFECSSTPFEDLSDTFQRIETDPYKFDVGALGRVYLRWRHEDNGGIRLKVGSKNPRGYCEADLVLELEAPFLPEPLFSIYVLPKNLSKHYRKSIRKCEKGYLKNPQDFRFQTTRYDPSEGVVISTGIFIGCRQYVSDRSIGMVYATPESSVLIFYIYDTLFIMEGE
jgi:hypothetical protein